MKLRYEIRDRYHPEWRGQRFATLARARRELAYGVPPERWQLWDREERREVAARCGGTHRLGLACDCDPDPS